ncbi:MAG: hypothetical protein GX321_05970 [Clostridiales bacterium]|nr:hypothetical protein [Clostridiales bacterium]
MLYVNIAINILFLILFIDSRKNHKEGLTAIDKKKYSLYFLYPITRQLFIRTGLDKKLISRTDISEKIRAIHLTDSQEIQVKLYWYQKISIIILCILISSNFSLISQIIERSSHSIKFDTRLIRPEDGQGDETLALRFRMEHERDKEDFYEDVIIVQNRERRYTESEWKEVLKEAIPYLEREMLGDNEDANHVNRKLNFISQIPKTSIMVEWIPKDYLLITSDGEINNKDMGDEKVETLVTAILKYQDKKVEHTIPITILPMTFEKDEKLYKDLVSTLDKASQTKETDKNWNLPQRLGKYLITWERQESTSSISLFVLGLFASALVWFYKDKELEDKIKLRNNQMLLDYPEIINKFNLLVNAGMTIKQAWIKISEDYKHTADNKGGEIRYAYEEMLLTVNEFKLGIPEAKAYEQFGMRVGLLPFMKFGSMLVQNLKKGNKGMVDLLQREAREAFHERKETAKRLGEEASTKLLGPMLMMLIIVLIIIMIPAFISFSI